MNQQENYYSDAQIAIFLSMLESGWSSSVARAKAGISHRAYQLKLQTDDRVKDAINAYRKSIYDKKKFKV